MSIALIASSFFGGLLSFFSPCIIPLLPGYLAYTSGVSAKELLSGKPKLATRIRVIIGLLSFGVGFSLIFILLGATSTFFGSLLFEYRYTVEKVLGVLIIFLGLHMTGILKIKALLGEKKSHFSGFVRAPFYVNAFIIGIAFSVGWAPCISPILSGILTLAALQGSVYQGMILLGAYSMGIFVPLFIVGLSVSTLITKIRSLKFLKYTNIVSGVLLMILGVFLVSGLLGIISSFTLSLSYKL